MTGLYKLSKQFPLTVKQIRFSEGILNVSELFVSIYNESQHAEQLGLSLIAGPGYRKALEFLIKDYCIWLDSNNEKEIKSMLLVPVIKAFVNDSRIKSVAEKAAWLGNDETHFVRKWETKDINDLKMLIELIVRFIESEVMMNYYDEQMKR